MKIALLCLFNVLCACVYNMQAFSLPSWLHTGYALLLYTCLFMALTGCCIRLKKAGWVVLPLFHILGAMLAYFYLVYNRTLCYDNLASILEADAFEIDSFVTLPLVGVVFCALVLAAVQLFLTRTMRLSGKNGTVLLLALFCVFLLLKEGGKRGLDLLGDTSDLREFLGTRNIVPLSFFSVLGTYVVEENRSLNLLQLPSPATLRSERAQTPRPIVVLVIGESARGDHFSLNGYARETTPHVQKETQLVNFGICESFATQTRKSLVGMLTNATAEFREPTLGSFVHLYNAHGFDTYFFSRQNRLGRSGHLTDALVSCAKHVEYLQQDGTDLALLQKTEPLFREKRSATLVLLHTLGSHFDYRRNYTDAFRVFVPDDYTPETLHKKQNNVINAYDNTILTTDAFLFGLYEQLRDRNAVVVYVSDHGQLLGEHGLFLHAVSSEEYPEQKNIPFFLWYSDSFAKNNPVMVANLKQAASPSPPRTSPITHDYLYHTLIALAGIRSEAVLPQWDLTGLGSLK